MTVPDAVLDVVGYCPEDRSRLHFEGDSWQCGTCGTTWDHEGKGGERPTGAPPFITDRPTDSTSPTVLDQPQPD